MYDTALEAKKIYEDLATLRGAVEGSALGTAALESIVEVMHTARLMTNRGEALHQAVRAYKGEPR